MNDFRLKVFLSVAKNLSFTKASQELFISQPAVSKHIHELESLYHVRLFERLGNKIILTPAGCTFRQHAEKIIHAYKHLDYEMNLLQNVCSGELRIGASTTIAQYVLPQLLARYTCKFPQVKVSLLNGNSRDIEKALLNHEIDLGMVEGINRTSNLKYSSFLSDELVAVVHTKSRLSVIDEISIQELLSLPFVFRERGSGTLDVVERVLSAHNISLSNLNVVMYLGSTESIKSFLEYADCIGIVSIRSVRKEIMSGKLKVIDIKDLSFDREFSFAQLQGEETGMPEHFIRFASSHNKKL